MEKTKLCGAVILSVLSTFHPAQASDVSGPGQVRNTQTEMAYFLSSSIPEKDLATLIGAAESRHIPVYFRGLVNDSMEQTAQYMMHMVTTYHIQGIAIDPVRFEKYGVKQVPALVKKCGDTFDILYGNLSFNDAMKLMDTQGDCAKQPDGSQP
ncbi:type-F conjugative transfer system pilin assembly protein TrbC [Pantoea sp. BAV 3049]|uniref:type-F conjugative transfer system pilin assembly protein TrbC n=1 Tax=Pantoea sp. BAV 3049 TaxID=2654188 RepID=UPI00131D3914|nr:type-F conjugative transfer system pilin assembly protein TrbC [Pantoea sp. BAV 3049]